MSKFRPAPKLQQQAEDNFIKGAESPRPAPLKTQSVTKTVAPKKKAEAPVVAPPTANSKAPWEVHDPTAKEIATSQPLRLNDYQYEQLKWLAEKEDRSLAQILRRLIAPALDEAVRQ